jgi:transformation/transcription domain-associated protein
MLSYEDVVATNVHALIQSCPIESVSTRKELLVDFRHILATDFRRGFIPFLDSFLDENFLMGPGRQAYESLRPLAFLTISDVVHHTRDTLNFSQISRVVYLFSKNLHDHELSASIQTTSVRILVSIAERFASTHYDQVYTHSLTPLPHSLTHSLTHSLSLSL